MDRTKLEQARCLVRSVVKPDNNVLANAIWLIIEVLLKESKPVAIETIIDKRTRLKKLILEMLEIV